MRACERQPLLKVFVIRKNDCASDIANFDGPQSLNELTDLVLLGLDLFVFSRSLIWSIIFLISISTMAGTMIWKTLQFIWPSLYSAAQINCNFFSLHHILDKKCVKLKNEATNTKLMVYTLHNNRSFWPGQQFRRWKKYINTCGVLAQSFYQPTNTFSEALSSMSCHF